MAGPPVLLGCVCDERRGRLYITHDLELICIEETKNREQKGRLGFVPQTPWMWCGGDDQLGWSYVRAQRWDRSI